MIINVFSKQSLIFQAKILHPYNTFIQYSNGISNEMSNKTPKHKELLSVLKKYIWFLIDEVLFFEIFLAREKTKKLLQTVMKIIESHRAAYCKQ